MLNPGLDIGILYVFAIGSLAVYGIILGRVEREQQVLAPRLAARQRPDHQLRDPAGHVGARRVPDRRLAEPRERSSTGRRGTAPGGSSCSSRWRSCSSWSASTPRATACRSTCRRPSRNWSAATTPSIEPETRAHAALASTSTWSPPASSDGGLFFGGWSLFGLETIFDHPVADAVLKLIIICSKMVASVPLRAGHPLDDPAVPLRPADGPGVEGDDPAGAVNLRLRDGGEAVRLAADVCSPALPSLLFVGGRIAFCQLARFGDKPEAQSREATAGDSGWRDLRELTMHGGQDVSNWTRQPPSVNRIRSASPGDIRCRSPNPK